jgi:hypothetical protein
MFVGWDKFIGEPPIVVCDDDDVPKFEDFVKYLFISSKNGISEATMDADDNFILVGSDEEEVGGGGRGCSTGLISIPIHMLIIICGSQ